MSVGRRRVEIDSNGARDRTKRIYRTTKMSAGRHDRRNDRKSLPPLLRRINSREYRQQRHAIYKQERLTTEGYVIILPLITNKIPSFRGLPVRSSISDVVSSPAIKCLGRPNAAGPRRSHTCARHPQLPEIPCRPTIWYNGTTARPVRSVASVSHASRGYSGPRLPRVCTSRFHSAKRNHRSTFAIVHRPYTVCGLHDYSYANQAHLGDRYRVRSEEP